MSAKGKHVVVGFDGSEPSRSALALAARLAEPDGALRVVHAYWVPQEFHLYEFFEDLERAYAEVGRETVDEARGVISDTGLAVDYAAIEGKAADVLCQEAADRQPDLLVLGSRGHGRLPLGSVSARVLTNASCPVVVVPAGATVPERGGKLERILVAIDGSEHCGRALEQAVSIATATGAQITLLAVAPEPVDLIFGSPELPSEVVNLTTAIEAELGKLLDGAAEVCRKADVACSQSVMRGSPGPKIVEELSGDGYDLVALGSRGRGKAKALALGSVSNYVVQRSPVPVLVAHVG